MAEQACPEIPAGDLCPTRRRRLRPLRFVRRYWPLLLVLAAVAAWWPMLDYLSDFRRPDVPLVHTPHEVVAAMLDLAEVTPEDLVYDLGSGAGRILLPAVRDRGARAVGIEIDPELVESSREALRAAGVAERARVRRGDIFKQDLTPAKVITRFLHPHVNVRLRPQLDKLQPGTRIVSHMFSMPGAKPVKKVACKDNETNYEYTLYLWVAPIQWE
jgi:SAM-dependent methyltransferase